LFGGCRHRRGDPSGAVHETKEWTDTILRGLYRARVTIVEWCLPSNPAGRIDLLRRPIEGNPVLECQFISVLPSSVVKPFGELGVDLNKLYKLVR
jgi:hypothetical protein